MKEVWRKVGIGIMASVIAAAILMLIFGVLILWLGW